MNYLKAACILVVAVVLFHVACSVEQPQVFEVLHTDGTAECMKAYKSMMLVRKDTLFVMRLAGNAGVPAGDFYGLQKVQSIKSPGQCKGLNFNKDTKEWMP